MGETPEPDLQDRWEWERARQEFVADEREREADERERIADEREEAADLRDRFPDRSEPAEVRASAARERSAAALARRTARTARELSRSRRRSSPTVLAESFASISSQLFAAGSLDDVLERVASVATELIPGCTACSVTVLTSNGPTTPVAHGPGALESDLAQYQAGEGPCLSAVTEPSVFTPEVGRDPRWPRLARHYRSPLQSVASFGLYEAWATESTAPRASLNVYGTGIDAFDDQARELGMLLAAHASTAIVVVHELETSRRTATQLTEALRNRDVIGQAKGILMERSKLTAEDAFEVLRRSSQAYNRKLLEIAERLTLTGGLPDDPPEPDPSP